MEIVKFDDADPPELIATLPVLRDTDGPAGETVAESVTVPEKPLMLASVRPAVLEAPGEKLKLLGLEEILKPTAETIMVAGTFMVPLTPVTVTTKVPAGVDPSVDTVRVELPEPPDASVTLLVLNDTEGPEGEIDADKDTVPAEPPRLATLIVDLAEEPVGIVK